MLETSRNHGKRESRLTLRGHMPTLGEGLEWAWGSGWCWLCAILLDSVPCRADSWLQETLRKE